MLEDPFIRELIAGIKTESGEETASLATRFGNILPVNSVLALYGDLGAGKTTFVRGLARSWNITAPVTSPSYNLLSIHEGDRRLFHLDAYRLERVSQFDALMLDDLIRPPYCLAVEWPELIASRLPQERWNFRFDVLAENTHLLKLDPPNG